MPRLPFFWLCSILPVLLYYTFMANFSPLLYLLLYSTLCLFS